MQAGRGQHVCTYAGSTVYSYVQGCPQYECRRTKLALSASIRLSRVGLSLPDFDYGHVDPDLGGCLIDAIKQGRTNCRRNEFDYFRLGHLNPEDRK